MSPLNQLASTSFLLATAFLAMLGCTHRPVISSCDQLNWFEVGRQQGVIGNLLEEATTATKSCKLTVTSEFQNRYINGYHAGLFEYCLPESGFSIGYEGRLLKPNCPVQFSEDHKVGYAHGIEARRLEASQKTVNIKIKSLAQQLKTNDLKIAARKALESTLAKLNTLQSEKSEKLSKIFDAQEKSEQHMDL